LYKYTIAKQIANKKVITSKGEDLGKIVDLVIDEGSGEIEALLVEIMPDSKFVKKKGLTDKIVEVPYASVTAVSDVIIVDEKGIPSD